MKAKPRVRAFTLIELLVVIAILGTLLGLTMAAVQRARAASQRVECASNLHQLGLALHGYHDHQGAFPPGTRASPDPYPYLAWTARLLPYLEQSAAWEQTRADYRRQTSFFAPAPHANLALVLRVLVCPADGRTRGFIEPENHWVAFTHYLGVAGRAGYLGDGVLYFDSRVRMADITDGTSNTLAVGERPPSPDNRFGWWYAGVGQQLDGSADAYMGVKDYRVTFRAPTCPFGPYSFRDGSSKNPCDAFHFWSRHPGGAHFLFADGAVHFLSYAAAPLLPALATRSGGESVSSAEW